jgi:hypothetical protein
MMTIGFGALRAWRRRSTQAAAPPSSRTIPRWERAAPHVPASYLALYTYLDHRYASTVVLTFEQIEALLECALPVPATNEAGWWTAAASRTLSSAWTGAGRTARPNLLARTVTFERQVGNGGVAGVSVR